MANNSKCIKCPITATQKILSGKWKIVIIWLLSDSVKRFSELQKLIPSISQTMLTSQLRELERDGLVHREVYKEIPPKVEYSLTPVGKNFLPVLEAMNKWGNEYLSL